MTLKIEVGDIFNAIKDQDCVFIHGCNAQGVMGSGIAKLVKVNYPEAYKGYKQVQKEQGLHLGQVIAVQTVEGPTIINAITQEFYGRDANVKYADYDAIIIVCQAVVKHFKDKPIHLPMIGGGLGNLDVKRLTAIFQEVFREVDATLWLKEE
jgi:O-acetyl-ADP-ribose deacetylase (regulator of RNase III)